LASHVTEFAVPTQIAEIGKYSESPQYQADEEIAHKGVRLRPESRIVEVNK
jgi:hypothetical protein